MPGPVSPLKLPNSERATVDIAKLRGYCLNPLHPKGGHKARVFQAALGLATKDAEWLRDRMLEVSSDEAIEAGITRFGRRYMIDFVLRTPVGQATVRSSWIVREEEDFPRLFTCYVKKKTRL